MAAANGQRLAVYSAGFWRNQHQRRILELAGWAVAPFASPFGAEAIGVWGRTPASRRGRMIAATAGKPVLTVEDACLRSIHPGRTTTSPVGLLLDRKGVYFDASSPSDLEDILNEGVPEDADLLKRARAGREFLESHGLSKYNQTPRGKGRLPAPGYVLVVDQRRGDASVMAGAATTQTFRAMLDAAVSENPGRDILVRTHPHGNAGYLRAANERPGVRVLLDPVNPWDILAGAAAVYCVSSQLGFEAILAGHRPHVFGLPFYAGWGLSEDRQRCPRRVQTLNVDALFAGVMLRYPTWYDPVSDTLCDFGQAAAVLGDHVHAAWAIPRRSICTGFSRWKHPHMRRFLQESAQRPRFIKNPASALRRAVKANREVLVWASREPRNLTTNAAELSVPLIRVEDGFLRSVGLGADLQAPVSLVFDDIGIHYDPAKPSALEGLITKAAALPPADLKRAARLRAAITEAGITKYNLEAGRIPRIKAAGRQVVLVAGQVEDDASVRHVAPDLGGNAGLLAAARSARPEAYLIYKPHPDVEAGLRPGHVADADVLLLADYLAAGTGATTLIPLVDEVWTMSSLLGFEALLRGGRVICLGMPFYAGWGLTEDRGINCERRQARPSLDALVHAALIEYPVYLDHQSGIFTSPERMVELLSGQARSEIGSVAGMQRRLASMAGLWRGVRRGPFAQDVSADDLARQQGKPGHIVQTLSPESGD